MQTIAVAVIVLLCVVYIIRHIARNLRGKDGCSSCPSRGKGCGCADCGCRDNKS